MESPIEQFYRGRGVFITGGSGFLGKVLIEKLLRSCPGIDAVYVLIRPKRGVKVDDRLEEIVRSQLFDVLRCERPAALAKLVAVSGDISLPDGMGICAADLQTLKSKVSVVFHSAARVRFDQNVQEPTEMNVEGTRQLLLLCRQLSHLEAIKLLNRQYSLN